MKFKKRGEERGAGKLETCEGNSEVCEADCGHVCRKMDSQAGDQSWRHQLGPCLEALSPRDMRTSQPSHTETSEDARASHVNES